MKTWAFHPVHHETINMNLAWQISKEDIDIATEVARAADDAASKIRTRRVRQHLMDRCARSAEKLCRERKKRVEGKPHENWNLPPPLGQVRFVNTLRLAAGFFTTPLK